MILSFQSVLSQIHKPIKKEPIWSLSSAVSYLQRRLLHYIITLPPQTYTHRNFCRCGREHLAWKTIIFSYHLSFQWAFICKRNAIWTVRQLSSCTNKSDFSFPKFGSLHKPKEWGGEVLNNSSSYFLIECTREEFCFLGFILIRSWFLHSPVGFLEDAQGFCIPCLNSFFLFPAFQSHI